MRLPTRRRVWLTIGLCPAGHRDEAWRRGAPELRASSSPTPSPVPARRAIAPTMDPIRCVVRQPTCLEPLIPRRGHDRQHSDDLAKGKHSPGNGGRWLRG